MEEIKKSYLRGISAWTKFFGILYSISAGFLILFGIIAAIAGFAGEEAIAAILGCVYVVLGGVVIIPTVYMFKSSGALKAGLVADDETKLTEAAKNGRSTLKFMGIMSIVVIALSIIAVVIIAAVGVAEAF